MSRVAITMLLATVSVIVLLAALIFKSVDIGE